MKRIHKHILLLGCHNPESRRALTGEMGDFYGARDGVTVAMTALQATAGREAAELYKTPIQLYARQCPPTKERVAGDVSMGRNGRCRYGIK